MKIESKDDARTVIETTLIPHSAFQSALSRVQQCISYAPYSSEPCGVQVIGESRTGKSRLIEEIMRDFPTIRTSDGLVVRILYVKPPSLPTVKGLVELLLWALGDPLFYSGTENVKTLRLKNLMKAAGTLVVVLDEFQHFYDKGARKIMHHVADWLKIFLDDTKVSIVVAGLPTCLIVLEQNEQLYGRFQSPAVLPRFDWRDDHSREEFVAILGAFQESMSRFFNVPDLTTDEMAFRMYCASGGLIGYLAKFLRQTVWNLLDAKKTVMRLSDLEIGHNQSVWLRHGLSEMPSPFSRKFSLISDQELLRKIQTIGTANEPVEKTRMQKRGTKKNNG